MSEIRIAASILDRIGGTPLIELRAFRPVDCARILLTIEAEKPTCSTTEIYLPFWF